MQDIEQFGRVLAQPVVGLNLAEFGRWPPVANDRPLTVFFTIAEPLRQNLPAGSEKCQPPIAGVLPRPGKLTIPCATIVLGRRPVRNYPPLPVCRRFVDGTGLHLLAKLRNLTQDTNGRNFLKRVCDKVHRCT